MAKKTARAKSGGSTAKKAKRGPRKPVADKPNVDGVTTAPAAGKSVPPPPKKSTAPPPKKSTAPPPKKSTAPPPKKSTPPPPPETGSQPPAGTAAAEEWARNARMRIMAVESSRRLTALAADRRLERDAHGNEVAKRAFQLAHWLQESGQALVRGASGDEIEKRRHVEIEKTVERMWNARYPRNAETIVVIAIADLLELASKDGVAPAMAAVRGGQPDFGHVNPELIRVASDAWTQGKRRGPIRVLAKAVGVVIPADEVIDKALSKR